MAKLVPGYSLTEKIPRGDRSHPTVTENTMSAIDPDRVPTTLDEALEMLERRMSNEDREFLENSDKKPTAQMHHKFGMSLRNDWSLWEKDMPLVKWFNERGISHADDMSAIILTSIWRLRARCGSRLRGTNQELPGLLDSKHRQACSIE